MTAIELKNFAKENNLQYIEMTSGMNGYPEHLTPALSGFDTYEQAAELAHKLNGSLVIAHQRDGWHFWNGKNDTAYEAIDQMEWMERDNENYGGDYIFDEDDLSRAIEGINDYLEDEIYNLDEDDEDYQEQLDELKADAEATIKKLQDAFNAKTASQFIYYHEGDEIETHDRYVTSYSYDTHNYQIAINFWQD